MDPLKRSPAKKAKPSRAAAPDTRPFQVVGEVTTKPCGNGYCDVLLLKRATGRGVVWYCCAKNVQGDPNSCPLTANTFHPEHDPSKTQTKLICVICILPVNGAVYIGKKLEGESDEDGKASKCFFVFCFYFCDVVRGGLLFPLRRTYGTRIISHSSAAVFSLLSSPSVDCLLLLCVPIFHSGAYHFRLLLCIALCVSRNLRASTLKCDCFAKLARIKYVPYVL